MSLKAKLEAVIYAAEEPVTLAQLALVFTEEALGWKAEQDALAGEASGAEAPAPVNAELNYAEFDYQPVESAPEPEGGYGSAAIESSEAGAEAGLNSNLDSNLEASSDAALEPAGEDAAGDAAAAEAAEKKLARQRDRDVRAVLKQLLDELIAEYAADGRGIEIREIAGGYRMATKPECHDVVRAFVKSLKPALKLSLPALETLAVVAYKQPVTAPEVNEIRGVDSSGVFGSLLARKLIATAGRKQVIGRPILYKTTREFLLRFGLKDVNELPSMEEFEKMAAMELDDTPAAAEDEATGEVSSEVAGEISAEVSGENSSASNIETEPDEDAGQDAGVENADEVVAMTTENDLTAEPVPGGTEQAKD